MSQAGETPRPTAFSVFRKRSFTALWCGQLISQFGSGITSIVASILVYRETGSALSVGLMLIATSLPGFLFGLIAGVFVDRLDRRRIMIGAEVLRAILVLLIPVLLPATIWWLYILVALSATVAQFFNPARASVMPDVASDEELAAANSLMSIAETGALGLGFAAAGLITSRYPIEWAFYINALTYLLSGVAILLVKIPPLALKGEKTSVAAVASNLSAGARFLWDSRILRSTLLVVIPMSILTGLYNSLLLPFADRALGATEFEYGLIEGLSMVGFVVGGLVMTGVAGRLREGQWIAIGSLGMGLADAIFSQVPTVPLAISLGAAASFMNVPSYIGRQLVIQRNTTREVRGRVTSTFYVTRDVMFMIGMGVAALADYIDVRLLILTEALLQLGLGVVVLFMPGLGQPAAEWRKVTSLLRRAPEAPGLELGRPATLADFDRLAGRLPAMSVLSPQERAQLAAQARVREAPAGTVIIRRGEVSDAAYFLLEGRTFAGWEEAGAYRILSVHSAGDFFGEIAALAGIPRTAYVVAEEDTTLLQVPAGALQAMTNKPELRRLFLSTMRERLISMDMLDIPRLTTRNQELMRELRTPEPQPEAAAA